MEGVDGDAHRRRIVWHRKVQGLAEGGNQRTVRGIHRMQRLKHQPDAVLHGERHQVSEAVGDAPAGSDHVLLPRREPADHQEQLPGVQRHGLKDRGAVVRQRGGLPLGVGRCQEAAAA